MSLKWIYSIMVILSVTLVFMMLDNAKAIKSYLPFVEEEAFFEEPIEIDRLVSSGSEVEQRSNEKNSGEEPEISKLSQEFSGLLNASEEDSRELDVEYTVDAITPTKVVIPSIGVEAVIEPVGILENGQMGVPSEADDVGWFEPGIKPGEQGNAVLAGHVDSRTGPAIFYHLSDLEAGDEIIVSNEEGEELIFTVRKKKSYPLGEAPIEEIFGSTDGRMLNLITCSGTFDQERGTHDERLVVFAELNDDHLKSELDRIGPPGSPSNVEVSGSSLSFHAVQDEDIAGYRVYEADKDGNAEHVASISPFERKRFNDVSSEHSYYVTTVDIHGQESEASERVSLEKNNDE